MTAAELHASLRRLAPDVEFDSHLCVACRWPRWYDLSVSCSVISRGELTTVYESADRCYELHRNPRLRVEPTLDTVGDLLTRLLLKAAKAVLRESQPDGSPPPAPWLAAQLDAALGLLRRELRYRRRAAARKRRLDQWQSAPTT